MRYTINSSDKLYIPRDLQPILDVYRKQSKQLRIEITPVFDLRSNQMNALFHANLHRIVNETGADFDEVKAEIKQMAVYRGFPYRRDEVGNPIVSGGELVPISSADATVEEFKILFYAMDDWLMNNDIDLGVIWQ